MHSFSFLLFAQTETVGMLDPNNPDCIYDKAQLDKCFIHMVKITDPSKGSAPAVEVMFTADLQWIPCAPEDGWGKQDQTYCYRENEVPGTTIFFNITNKLNDVTYYRIEGIHPFDLPLYDDPVEAEMLKRFVFFKFTAYAAKGGHFENYLNNLMWAVDTNTKLLYTYGMPGNYKKIIGNNYIPQNWLPYETHPNTADSKLKFYEYDPIGFISLEKDYDFLIDKYKGIVKLLFNENYLTKNNTFFIFICNSRFRITMQFIYTPMSFGIICIQLLTR